MDNGGIVINQKLRAVKVSEVERLSKENASLRATLQKMVRERAEAVCEYCNQNKPDIVACCRACYMESQ